MYSHFLSLSDDPDALLRAVESAPLLWERERWTGHGVAPLFIEAVTQYASRLASALERPALPVDPDHKAVEAFYEKELPDFFRRATRTLLARGDGRWLAIDYATELLRRTSWSRRQHDIEIRVKRVAVNALLDGLRDAGVSPSDVQRFARRRLPNTGSWSRRAEYLSVAGFMVNSAASAQTMWAAITELLVGLDDEDNFGTLDTYLIETPLLTGLGHALAETPSPRESWLHTWRGLYPNRERARFAALATKGLHSSVYLGLIGLSALRYLIKNRDDDANALWHTVTRGVRRLSTAPREYGFGIKFHQLVAVPWAFAPHVDGAAWSHWLADWSALFSVDPVACLMATDFLIRNGVARATALAAMTAAGCDPLVLGQEFCEWLVAKGFGTNVDDVDVAKLLTEVRGEVEPPRKAASGATATAHTPHVSADA